MMNERKVVILSGVSGSGLLCDVKVAHARNVHGVTFKTVSHQDDRINDRELPPWWSQRMVERCTCNDASCVLCDDQGMVPCGAGSSAGSSP